jgi:hypothetical protein
MNYSQIKDWLIPVSTFITLITTAIAAWLSLKEYRLKLKAETRLKYSAQVETDVQLLKLFTEIMNIAHGRSGYYVSEKILEFVLKDTNIKNILDNPEKTRELFKDMSVIALPVGKAQQDAAICAIATIAKRHEILRPLALQALESLNEFKSEVAKKYLDELRAEK